MNQLNDVSFMQMEFQIFKITIYLSNLSIPNFFVIFHWKLCTCEVALFEKLEFIEKVLFRCQKTHKHKLRFFFTFCNCSHRQLQRDQWSSSQATAQIQILCMVKLAIV